MKYDRWFRPSDPTFLAIAFGLFATYPMTGPWSRNWLRVPTEEPWMFLVLPQALAVAILGPRRPLAWVAVLLGLLLCWPSHGSFRWGAEPWVWRLTDVFSDWARAQCVGRAVFWGIAILAAAVAVKAYASVDWGAAVATAAVGMVGSLVASEGLLWLIEVLPRLPKTVTLVVQGIAFFSPAIVLPVLLWRTWPRMALWIATPIAGVALATVLLLDEQRTTPRAAAVAVTLILAGSLWAFVDSRFQRTRELGHGFEVLAPQA